MGLTKQLGRARSLYNEYPRQFWILMFGTFIDRLGGAMLFPFFTLYITKKFEVGMTEVGIIFGLFSISSVIGSMVGGALTDRLGRKGMLLFGLVMSALSSILMGVVEGIVLFCTVTLVVGVLADAGGPAQQAMVADLLPDEKRAQGFGIWRVIANLAVTIGPMIGGLLAAQSYLLLFIVDAVSSLITAVIVYFSIKETMPESCEEEAEQSMTQTFRGYLDVVRDVAFFWFLMASALMVLVYMQMNTTLAVYLRDSHGLSEQFFGYILSMNAGMVVLLQFPITRWITKYRPLLVMAVGTLLYAIGFAMYGFVTALSLFFVAMIIITVGEMFVSPVGQAIVARLAPEDMRGRYMAVYGFSWIIPIAVGPLLAGVVMDNADPNWVWYGSGILGLVAAAAFYLLGWVGDRATQTSVDKRLDVMEMLEEQKISAEEAARRLEAVPEGGLTRLSGASPDGERRHLRIQVSDTTSGMVKTDLRLPMGLVSTVLHMGGQLATDLDGLDTQELRELISKSADDESERWMETDGDERVEVSLE